MFAADILSPGEFAGLLRRSWLGRIGAIVVGKGEATEWTAEWDQDCVNRRARGVRKRDLSLAGAGLAGGYNAGYTRRMKTAVSIPDRVFEQAETVARRLAMSRSELYTRAIQEFLDAHRHDVVTEKLNEVYADEDSSIDPALMAMQATAIEDDQW